MKKNLFKLLFVMLFLLTVSFTFVYNNNTNVLADETETEEVVEPSLNIYKKNISYASEIYIMYAVSYEGIDVTTTPVKMLFYNTVQDEYTTQTASYVASSQGSVNIGGVSCQIFASNGLAAKQLTDDIYARAYVEINDEIIYSDVVKYSVLEYYYEIKEAGTVSTNILNLLEAMVNYGAAAQINFNYNTEKLANATYYKVSVENAVLPDGFTSGRFKAEEQVTLTATEKEGYVFTGWTNSNGEVISTEATYTLTVTKDETLTANYEEEVSVTPVTLTLTKEAAYDATADTLNLPTTVTFDYNNETVTENVTWDTTTFVVNKIGKQKLYGTLSNDLYKVNELSIEIDVLPYTFSLNEETNEYSITKYYGTTQEETIPETFNNVNVTTIKQYAFNEVSKLKSLVIPSSITLIEHSAIYCCANIEKITIPNLVGDYFGYIFGASSYQNTDGFLPYYLKEVTVLETVTSIKSNYFYNCKKLLSINFPSSITNIGENAFYNCNKLTSITIPSSVTSIGNYAFYGCGNLTNVYYDGTIESWCNISFSYFDSNPMFYAEHLYMKNEEDNWYEVIEIVIPDTIIKIGNYQFCGFENVTSITIPSSVISIGSYAFYYCTAEIIWNNPTITEIGSYAFTSYQGISITIPSSIISIGMHAFADCSAKIIWDNPTITEIGFYSFGSYKGTSITIPSSVTSIGSDAFSNCTNLTSIIISSNVTSVGYRSFGNCTAEIIWDNPIITEIHNSAFEDYKATSITIPSSVTSIGEYAFRYCTAEIIWNNPTITEIGSYAFAGYEGTSITIPSSVTSIGSYAFNNCTSLTNVYYEGTIETWCNIIFSGNNSNPMTYAEHFYMKNEEGNWYKVIEIIIPNTITKICNYQFCGFDKLTSITIPSSVTSIGFKAFAGCAAEIIWDNPTITEICRYAFSNYEGTSITIPSSVTSMGDEAFYNCTSLTNVYYEGTIEDWCNISINGKNSNPRYIADHIYMKNEEGNWYEVIEIIIPNTITKIGNYQFCGFDNVTSITIPSSVISIGSFAFYNCTAEIIWNNPTITEIGSYAFAGYQGTSITIPSSVIQIGIWAFSGCSAEIIWNNPTITAIETRAFASYQGTSITIPSSVTYIGTMTFENCTNLTSIYYEGTIEDWCNISINGFDSNPMYNAEHFYMKNEEGNWYEVTEIEIPNTITRIGNNQFYGFENIISITISNSVTSIGNFAFYSCTNLTDVYYTGTEEQWNSITIDSSNTSLTSATIHYNYVPSTEEE